MISRIAFGLAWACLPNFAMAEMTVQNSRYTCEGVTLTLSGDKLAAQWVFARVSH